MTEQQAQDIIDRLDCIIDRLGEIATELIMK